MVSTRQMATSGSSAGGAGNNNNSSNSNANNTMNDESSSSATTTTAPRLSVVTRQTTTTTSSSMPSSSTCLLPELATPTMAAAAAAAASNSAATTNYAQHSGSSSSTSETIARHNHHHQHYQHQNQQQSSLTQALNKTASAGSSAAADTACETDYTSALARPTAGCTATYSTTSAVKFLDLPIEIHSHIFSFMEFKRIGQMRVISKKMNEVCMHILNSTFSKLITKTYNRFHAIKAMMPRRESARRNHPLACECDIIETCYMRLSLLQMTFGKHIERGHCCFFPGAILDEVYTIFNYIQKTPRLERPYRVTDELFDLSTMAMEYFRDRIEPTLPGIANILYKDYFQVPTNTKRPPLVVTSDLSDSSSSLPSPPQSNMVLRKGIRKIKQGMKIYNNQLSVLRNELSTCKRKSTEQGKQIAEQQKLLAEQQKQALEYANRLDENDRKNEEMSRKFSTLLQELNKCKTELQYWRSKSPAIPICTSCGQKIAPVLPAEDYQALINQGVKPEDIILNMNDDTDAECDISTLSANAECNSTLNQNEFVFPDETTTAKLMAVNTAAKNLKRHHQQDQATGAADIHQQQQQATTSNSNHFNNRNSSLNVNTSMETTTKTTAAAAATTSNSLATTITSEATNQGNATLSAGGGPADVAASVCAKDLKCAGGQNLITPQPIHQSTSYSTKLFYGTQQQQHRSVIVTPNSIAAAASQASTSAAAAAAAATTSKAETQAASAAALNGTASDMCSSNNSNSNNNINNNNNFNHNTPTTTATTTIDATSLQSIAAHETKKARRVQKATRCLATSGGKRSK